MKIDKEMDENSRKPTESECRPELPFHTDWAGDTERERVAHFAELAAEQIGRPVKHGYIECLEETFNAIEHFQQWIIKSALEEGANPDGKPDVEKEELFKYLESIRHSCYRAIGFARKYFSDQAECKAMVDDLKGIERECQNNMSDQGDSPVSKKPVSQPVEGDAGSISSQTNGLHM